MSLPFDAVKKVFKTIQDLPDESVELILPQIEDEFKKLVDEQDLINKTKELKIDLLRVN